MVANISNTNPYLNEAITVQYRLYVSDQVNITRGWREIDSPKYRDFWSQNIDNRGNFKAYRGTYKGRDYQYVIVKTTVLYPQKTGELNIEALVLDVPVDVETNKRDIFGRRYVDRVNKTISAGNRTINVKPLPEQGKPIGFNGAVGNFDFSVNADRTTMDANESMQLEVKVSGSGNLKLFDLPGIKIPSTLEQFEPERSDNVRTAADGMKGSIAERYTIVPQYKGDYPIRPVSFSYFDPEAKVYKTINSNEIVLKVLNGPVTEATTDEATSNSNKKQVTVLTDDQFKYIKLQPDLEQQEQRSFFNSTLFYVLLGAPFLLVPVFIIAGARRKKRANDVEGNRIRKADRLAKKYLSEAKKNLGDKSAFYESLERALHNYLKGKLHIETSEFSKDRIASLLSERQVNAEMVDGFVGLLKSCEFARYAPASNVTIQQDYDKAVSVISSIDKQIV